MIRCDFSGTCLDHTDFTGADLTGSRLRRVKADFADFSRTIWDETDAVCLSVHSCRFSGISAKRADFSGAVFRNESIIEDAFAGVVFCQSSFLLAKLPGAPMRGAILRECDLREARLTGADLRDADLGGSNLDGTDLQHADLTGADTSGVDFSHGPKFYQTKRADRYPDKEFLGILTDVFEQFLREKDIRLPESPDTGPVLPDSVRTRLQKEIVRQAFIICASSRTGWCVPYKGGVNQKAILFLTRIADVLDSYLQGAGASIPSSEKEKKERNQENAPAVIFGSDMVSFIGMLAVVCQSACCSNGYLPVWRDAEGRLVTKS